METTALIKRLIIKFNKKEEDKLQEFIAKDLYAGEIVFFKKQVYTDAPHDQGRPITKPVKKFAIFAKIGPNEYIHLKSNQQLTTLEYLPTKNDYAVRKVKPLLERVKHHSIFGGMAEDKVLTLNDVIHIEKTINYMHFYNQKKNILFK